MGLVGDGLPGELQGLFAGGVGVDQQHRQVVAHHREIGGDFERAAVGVGGGVDAPGSCGASRCFVHHAAEEVGLRAGVGEFYGLVDQLEGGLVGAAVGGLPVKCPPCLGEGEAFFKAIGGDQGRDGFEPLLAGVGVVEVVGGEAHPGEAPVVVIAQVGLEETAGVVGAAGADEGFGEEGGEASPAVGRGGDDGAVGIEGFEGVVGLSHAELGLGDHDVGGEGVAGGAFAPLLGGVVEAVPLALVGEGDGEELRGFDRAGEVVDGTLGDVDGGVGLAQAEVDLGGGGLQGEELGVGVGEALESAGDGGAVFVGASGVGEEAGGGLGDGAVGRAGEQGAGDGSEGGVADQGGDFAGAQEEDFEAGVALGFVEPASSGGEGVFGLALEDVIGGEADPAGGVGGVGLGGGGVERGGVGGAAVAAGVSGADGLCLGGGEVDLGEVVQGRLGAVVLAELAVEVGGEGDGVGGGFLEEALDLGVGVGVAVGLGVEAGEEQAVVAGEVGAVLQGFEQAGGTGVLALGGEHGGGAAGGEGVEVGVIGEALEDGGGGGVVAVGLLVAGQLHGDLGGVGADALGGLGVLHGGSEPALEFACPGAQEVGLGVAGVAVDGLVEEGFGLGGVGLLGGEVPACAFEAPLGAVFAGEVFEAIDDAVGEWAVASADGGGEHLPLDIEALGEVVGDASVGVVGAGVVEVVQVRGADELPGGVGGLGGAFDQGQPGVGGPGFGGADGLGVGDFGRRAVGGVDHPHRVVIDAQVELSAERGEADQPVGGGGGLEFEHGVGDGFGVVGAAVPGEQFDLEQEHAFLARRAFEDAPDVVEGFAELAVAQGRRCFCPWPGHG